MKKFKLIVCAILLIFFFKMNAQTASAKDIFDFDINKQNEAINTIEFGIFGEEQSYIVNLINFNSHRFNSGISLRLEDELYASEQYKLWQEVSFLDFNLNYSIEAFNFSFNIDNILNYNDKTFAIEPDLVNNNVAFIQEDNFFIGLAITYNF